MGIEFLAARFRGKMRSAAAVRGSPEVQTTDGNQLRAAAAQGGPNPSTAEIGRKLGSDGGALVAARFREHGRRRGCGTEAGRRNQNATARTLARKPNRRRGAGVFGKSTDRTARGFSGREGTDGGVAERKSKKENGGGCGRKLKNERRRSYGKSQDERRRASGREPKTETLSTREPTDRRCGPAACEKNRRSESNSGDRQRPAARFTENRKRRRRFREKAHGNEEDREP
jgi:hypothetical protein